MAESIVERLEKRRTEYLRDLRVLTGIDSGSAHKAGVDAVNAWLAARLSGLGFAVERQAQAELGDNLVAMRRGKGSGRILLLGHADTVYPVGTAAERPMVVGGDEVRGPGTCDMKAGLLSAIYALEALEEIGFDDFESIAYLCVSDEESGVRRSIPLIQARSREADAVLTLEAARENGDIVVARKAVRWYTVEALGRAAHAGVEPEKGRSAILALARHIVALDGLNGLRPGATVNAGYVAGGSLPSVVADRARLRLDLRAATDEDMRVLDEAVHEQLARAVVPGVSVVATLEEGSACPAMGRTPAVVALEDLARRCARELGFAVKGAATGGASDASFAAAEGTAVLDGLGPVGGLDHSPKEYVRLSQIMPRTALLAKLIMAIARTEKEKRHGRGGSPAQVG